MFIKMKIDKEQNKQNPFHSYLWKQQVTVKQIQPGLPNVFLAKYMYKTCSKQKNQHFFISAPITRRVQLSAAALSGNMVFWIICMFPMQAEEKLHFTERRLGIWKTKQTKLLPDYTLNCTPVSPITRCITYHFRVFHVMNTYIFLILTILT